MRQKLRRIWHRLKPRRQIVTLAIDSLGIRLLETRGRAIEKWAVRPLSPDLFDSEVPVNPRALGIAIRQLLKANRVKPSNIIVGVSGLHSLSRTVSLPASPPKQPVTQATVQEKVKEVLPLAEEEIYLSWQPVVQTAEENRVLITGTPRNLLDGSIRAVKAGGGRVRVLELKAMALSRVVDREQALILNIEPATIDTVLIADGTVQSMHTAAWSPAGMSKNEMAEYLGVSLELNVGSYDSNRPGNPFDAGTPLFITGSMAADQELAAAILARVVYPAGTIVTKLECPAYFPVPEYAVNIGLALRAGAMKKQLPTEHLPLTMNLLPQIYRPWKPTARQVYVFLSVIAIIALLIPAYNLISNVNAKTINLRTEFNQGKAQMERRQVELASREPLQKFLDTYQSIVDMGGGFLDDLKVITDNAAIHGVEVPNVAFANGVITISAFADNYSGFRDFILNLQADGRFGSVTGPNELYPYVKEGQIRIKIKD